MYGSETLLWKEKERYRIRAVQKDNLRGLLGIRRIGQIREFSGVEKVIDERSDEVVLRWFGHVEIMEDDRIAKRVYVGKCVGSQSLGRAWKR